MILQNNIEILLKNVAGTIASSQLIEEYTAQVGFLTLSVTPVNELDTVLYIMTVVSLRDIIGLVVSTILTTPTATKTVATDEWVPH